MVTNPINDPPHQISGTSNNKGRGSSLVTPGRAIPQFPLLRSRSGGRQLKIPENKSSFLPDQCAVAQNHVTSLRKFPQRLVTNSISDPPHQISGDIEQQGGVSSPRYTWESHSGISVVTLQERRTSAEDSGKQILFPSRINALWVEDDFPFPIPLLEKPPNSRKNVRRLHGTLVANPCLLGRLDKTGTLI
ncbi:hypothetical protein CEXT_459851 [Caerostris extrusa]|uniref:Uncharacterized protein n=1 Tax=Caerostris extrusa TaxID=172846 RepID=A0AAV4UDK5_CAEEX|nr:hypothetical protein CEXT_459851 [Caerostris extrusa]